LSDNVIKKGARGKSHRYRCKNCGKNFQNRYTYRLYEPNDDRYLKVLNAEGVCTFRMIPQQ
jgi:transposase-like protein